MNEFNKSELKELYIPASGSHKGQNGKVMVIGGSHLFHAASLWALEIASKIVDMVFYASVLENEKIVQDAKKQFRNGIIVPKGKIEDYIEEADCVLIGPGMVRASHEIPNPKYQISKIIEIDQIKDEGMQTYYLTKYLLNKFPHKKWVVDAGALQMVDIEDLKRLGGNVIITPHSGEFERVFGERINENDAFIQKKAKEYQCVILCKGEKDIVCSPDERVSISGGNAGMTKGGTGDVLAGLVAALACKNDIFLAAKAGSFFNKKAGESLFQRVGYYFNASDLLREIPRVMKEYIIE
jgi:hydroxyethylthiazole kinase-like uncharacterized protein yjeF